MLMGSLSFYLTVKCPLISCSRLNVDEEGNEMLYYSPFLSGYQEWYSKSQPLLGCSSVDD